MTIHREIVELLVKVGGAADETMLAGALPTRYTPREFTEALLVLGRRRIIFWDSDGCVRYRTGRVRMEEAA